MLVLPKGENQFKRSEKRMELKGITCRIPLELHNRISEEIQEMGSTMGQFIEMIIREHYEKGEKKMMEKGRTLAFQVSEELFQKVKEYLAWYEKTYHRAEQEGSESGDEEEEPDKEETEDMSGESGDPEEWDESETPAEQNGARSWDQEEPAGEEEEDYIVENNWDETEDGEDEDGTQESGLEDQDEKTGTDNTDEPDELSDTEEFGSIPNSV